VIGFHGYARLSAIAIVLISWKETMDRRRWTDSDLLYLIPVVVCAVIASVPSRKTKYRARLMAGFYIGLAFLIVMNDYCSLVEDDLAEIVLRSLFCLVACTVIFVTVTHCISWCIGKRKPKWDRCQKCGYRLQGLVVPRCPECGTAFLEEQRKGLVTMQSEAEPTPTEREGE